MALTRCELFLQGIMHKKNIRKKKAIHLHFQPQRQKQNVESHPNPPHRLPAPRSSSLLRTSVLPRLVDVGHPTRQIPDGQVMRMLSIEYALEHHLVAPVVDLVPLDVDFVIAQPPRIKVSGELAGDDNFGGLRGEGARECGAVGAGGGIGGDGVILHEKVCVLRRVAGWEFVDKGGGIYSQRFLHFFFPDQQP